MKKMNASLVYEARRRCNGATVHAVDQIIHTLPMLIATHNDPRCKDKAGMARQIEDLEDKLWALAHRK